MNLLTRLDNYIILIYQLDLLIVLLYQLCIFFTISVRPIVLKDSFSDFYNVIINHRYISKSLFTTRTVVYLSIL